MLLSRSRSSRGKNSPRRDNGLAAVEFALLLPLLAMFVLGMFEISRGILVKEGLNDAARQGCRTGVLPGRSNTDITNEINGILQDHKLSTTDATVTVQVNDKDADASTAKQNDKVSVKISIPASKVSWTSAFRFLGSDSVHSETVVMMRQG